MSSCLFTESEELADEDARYQSEYESCCDEYTSMGAEACPICGYEIVYDEPLISI